MIDEFRKSRSVLSYQRHPHDFKRLFAIISCLQKEDTEQPGSVLPECILQTSMVLCLEHVLRTYCSVFIFRDIFGGLN